MTKKDKKVEKIQKYIIEVIIYEDGSTRMNRTCDGFNALELLGVLEFTQIEIMEQIKGRIKPDLVKRTVLTD
jgi:D-Tyr-tRNAtyr deacylase